MKRGRGLLLGTSLVALTGLVALTRDESPERASAHGRRRPTPALHETIALEPARPEAAPTPHATDSPPPTAPPLDLPEWARGTPPGGPLQPEDVSAQTPPASFDELLRDPAALAALVLANPPGLEDRALSATASTRREERRLGLEVLAALSSKHAAAPALGWLREGLDPLAALDALAVPDAERAPQVRETLTNLTRNAPDPEARRLAVQRLAAWGGELSPLLASPHPDVRVASALTLAEGHPDPAQRATLARMAFSDPDPDARDAAARTLAALEDRTQEEDLAIAAVERDQGLER